MFPLLPDSVTQARLHDLAKARAVVLRREAINDFWRCADAALQHSLMTGYTSIERSADRLKARLTRHINSRRSGV